MDLNYAISFINTKVLWSPLLIVLYLCSGVYFTLCFRFLQVRSLKPILKAFFKAKGSRHGIPTFQALSVLVLGMAGTGNITGIILSFFLPFPQQKLPEPWGISGWG